MLLNAHVGTRSRHGHALVVQPEKDGVCTTGMTQLNDRPPPRGPTQGIRKNPRLGAVHLPQYRGISIHFNLHGETALAHGGDSTDVEPHGIACLSMAWNAAAEVTQIGIEFHLDVTAVLSDGPQIAVGDVVRAGHAAPQQRRRNRHFQISTGI